MSVRTALLMSASLLLGGCEVASEIGKECTLVRKATAEEEVTFGKKFRPILQGEVAPNQDVISFGSIECEDLVCVRDADVPFEMMQNPEDPEGPQIINRGAEAKGYCSKECVEGSNACEVKDTSGVLEGLPQRMTCRSLLLDQDTLEALRSSDEAFYRRTFGENNSPFFCAGTPASAQGN
ncbi:adventurous gliding motility lipoprotein CglC [Pyxidicoccus xibeiensis]|uniref:adventurous gliding motility lipoprotein CglC n=1 Tax=Pyxidicoccus xibeiensis TaxID=2906759 RepID=UPI0020A70459|nr:adventurous gliding motility lipoprotein CglC [Pyxidicoccus xibeiensis]MCP3141320.1 adventurous gliding motility lipoprotein CglC [Pyxidicoccus xibeiensis]